jgi:hypothetical protein
MKTAKTLLILLVIASVSMAKSYDDYMKELAAELSVSDVSVKEAVKPAKAASEEKDMPAASNTKTLKNRHGIKHGGDVKLPEHEPAIPNDLSNISIKNTGDNYLTLGFGYQNITLDDESRAFGINALDDAAMNINIGYGHYFASENEDYRFYVDGKFEFLQLKQSNLKNITTSINTQTNLSEDVSGYVGVKAGVSYFTWDIAQSEVAVSDTSTSPLFGIHAGIEYHFDEGISIVLDVEATKYFHETVIPGGTLTLDMGYGALIGFKFYL